MNQEECMHIVESQYKIYKYTSIAYTKTIDKNLDWKDFANL
jgi:hypothetical protein